MRAHHLATRGRAGSRLIADIARRRRAGSHRRLRPSASPRARRTSSSVKVRSNSRMNGPMAARRVVVLRLAEQQRRAAFEVAQVDVVAERRADDPAARSRRPARPPAPDCSRSRPRACRSRRRCRPRAIGCALVKISASGPMPTSRYCDHSPLRLQQLLQLHRLRRAGLEPGDRAAERRSRPRRAPPRHAPARRAPAPRSPARAARSRT